MAKAPEILSASDLDGIASTIVKDIDVVDSFYKQHLVNVGFNAAFETYKGLKQSAERKNISIDEIRLAAQMAIMNALRSMQPDENLEQAA